MKEKLLLLEEVLVEINKEIKDKPILEVHKNNLKQLLNSNSLYLNDINNPLQIIISNYFYTILNDIVKDPNGLRELLDKLNKFTQNMLIKSPIEAPVIKTEKKVLGYNIMGQPIIEEVPIKAVGNISLKSGDGFNTVLNTTGNSNYDKYLDELEKWSRTSNMTIAKDITLSAFCHILNLFQKALKLTQPDENPTSIYRNYIKRFFNRQ